MQILINATMKKKSVTFLVLLTLLVMIDRIANAQTYVNLGLPSGTLWADRNVGAASPEDYGDYFAWGETTAKSNYTWSTYTYANGDYNKLTKYCSKSDFGNNGYTDTLTTLERTDDAATANWGSDWCMPTPAQFQELKANCTWTKTKRNGKKGYEVKGKNVNSIFLPAAGCRYGTDLGSAGSYGNYWSSSLFTDYPDSGRYLYFSSSYVDPDDWSGRRCGQSVRAVRSK